MLDEPILTMLGLQHTMVDVLIKNQQWALPNHFTTCFPDIAKTIGCSSSLSSLSW